MPRQSLRRHLTRVGTAALAILAVGAYLGQLPMATALGLGAYAAWLLFNMSRLSTWLEGDAPDPPESVGIWSEIFERIHQLQKRNREQQERSETTIREFRSLTDAFPDATLVLDEHDGITWFNQTARRLLGLRSPEDIGQPVTNLLRDPDFADWISVVDHVESAFEMGSPVDPDVRLSVASVRHSEDQRLLILRDVTDLHNLEQIRRDFVANVSHELRTPLTVLLGYLESLHDQVDVELEPAIARMQEQGWQMQALLNDLLELSRLQTESRPDPDTAVNVCTLLTKLHQQAEEISQGNHDISVDCVPGSFMMGNVKDLESAFRNLIANAIHYTPKGGTIAVQWRAKDEGLVFSVTDTGIGIPRRDVPRLTERFYRVGSDRARHRGGTGLGLSIVKHVLNAHGARLRIHSELGEGSTFSCIFPHTRQVNASETQSRALP